MSESLKKLGRRIRRIRTEKGISQEKISEQSEISSRYVSELERGQANISVQILEKVAASLGVTPRDLLDNDHEGSRELLEKEMCDFIKTVSDEKVRLFYRLMKDLI